jgi:hypothetical protein
MPTLKTINDTHVSPPHKTGLLPDEARCPYCDGPVSRKQYREIRARIEAEESARIADVEKGLQERFAREKAKAESQKAAEIEKAKRDVAKVAEQQIKTLKAGQDAAIKARLDAERDTAAKKLAEAVSAEKVKAFEEKTRLTEQLADMQRKLERKTAHELGEPAEVDLYEKLRAEFPKDQISRVVKGQKGPDIILEIVHNGTVVGSIAIDSKNHSRWQNSFTRKLRADQLAEGADFAILSSNVFPSGAQQLHIQDGVIVASPARVSVLVHLLRRQIVQSHLLKLGSEGQNEKASRLLDFIVSPACTDLFDRNVKLTEELVAIDVREASSHAATWKKRSELIRGIRSVHDSFAENIDRIIGITGSEESP